MSLISWHVNVFKGDCVALWHTVLCRKWSPEGAAAPAAGHSEARGNYFTFEINHSNSLKCLTHYSVGVKLLKKGKFDA